MDRAESEILWRLEFLVGNGSEQRSSFRKGFEILNEMVEPTYNKYYFPKHFIY